MLEADKQLITCLLIFQRPIFLSLIVNYICFRELKKKHLERARSVIVGKEKKQ